MNGPIFTADVRGPRPRVRRAGIRAAGARSGRAIQTTKGPITKPDDLKGIRLRIPPIDMFRAAFESVGVRPVPMGLSDIYQALSRGQVDGQDNGFDLSLSFKWHEVAKYWSATDQCFELAAWYMSEKLWQSMTPADRELFKRAARSEGGEVATKLGEEIDRNGIEELKEAGVTYVVPDVAGASARRSRTRTSPTKGKVWPAGLVDRIRAMQRLERACAPSAPRAPARGFRGAPVRSGGRQADPRDRPVRARRPRRREAPRLGGRGIRRRGAGDRRPAARRPPLLRRRAAGARPAGARSGIVWLTFLGFALARPVGARTSASTSSTTGWPRTRAYGSRIVFDALMLALGGDRSP